MAASKWREQLVSSLVGEYCNGMSFAVKRGSAHESQRYLDARLAEIAAGRNLRDVPLPELIYHSMREHPQDVHMINGATGVSFTNDQILRRAVSLANTLLARRLTGSALMCVMRNREELVTIYYAALFAGVKVFLLDPQSTKTELNHFLPLVEALLVVCDSDRLGDVRESVSSYGKISVADAVVAHDQLEKFGSGDDNPAAFKPVPVSPQSCAVLLPTSGSTGLPKVAEITHAGLLDQLPMLWWYYSKFPTPTPRLMFMSTAQWMTFTNFLTSCPVYCVTLIVTPDKTMPTILRIIETCKPTWLLLVPGTATALSEAATKEQLASIQKILITGAAPSAKTLRNLEALIPAAVVSNSYGMTEAMGWTATAHKDMPFETVGKVFNIFQYKLVDDDGKVVARGEKGELYLKGDSTIKCYVKNEEAHRECSTADGWWRTGDVFTEDDEGHLFFVERKRFWFKYLNYHVSPEELESVINGVEGVLEAVVVGSERGAAAAIVKEPGATVTKEDIHRVVNSTLIEYKRLRGGIAFVDRLPRTHSGKLHRADCTRFVNRLIKTGQCC